MLGRIVFSQDRKVALHREMLNGLPFECVSLSARNPTRRQIRKAARLLSRAGVRRVIAPSELPCWPELERCGIIPVDPVPFLQALAVPLALAALSQIGVSPLHATAVLAGNRTSKAFCDAAISLCPLIQRLVILAPSGGDLLADYLRREYGLPLLKQCPSPHLALLFSEPETEFDAPALRLYTPTPDILGISIKPQKHFADEDLEDLPFLAVLWETGRLALRDIAVFPCQGS